MKYWTAKDWQTYHRVYAERDAYWDQYLSVYRQDGIIFAETVAEADPSEEVRDILPRET